MADKEKKEVFSILSALDVNEHTEQKEGLTYLSWAWAWDVVKRNYPEAQYTIWKDENNKPYVYDELTGYMVYTSVTIDGITHEMWLPVMDSKNKAMKAEPYTYKTKYGEKTVEPATMFDINKSIMRCLVKNLAMFGLGLYIYAGEDLPTVELDEDVQKVADYVSKRRPEYVKGVCEHYSVKKITELTKEQAKDFLAKIEDTKKREKKENKTA